jgi:hypothetical protein
MPGVPFQQMEDDIELALSDLEQALDEPQPRQLMLPANQ